jgi:serine/threonine protein kinase
LDKPPRSKGVKRVATCPHTLAALDTSSLAKKQHGRRNHRPFLELYELGDVIGTGGYAVVRECVHKNTGEKFAAKMMVVSENPVSGDRNIDREVLLATIGMH